MISLNLKSTLKVLLLLLTLGLMTNHSAFAADPTLDPPLETTEEAAINEQHKQLLWTGNFAELDKEMNHIQSEYEKGNISDIKLRNLSYAFYDKNPALEGLFSEWVEAYPKSYVARVARGIYLRRMGRAVRGTRYTSETKQHDLNMMKIYMDAAMSDLTESLKLTEKPLLSLFNLLNIANSTGDREMAEVMAATANKIDPKNFIIRYKYMFMLQTRWSGSLEEMEEYRKEIEKVNYPPELLKIFDDLIWEEKNWLAEQEIEGFSKGIK